MAPMMFAVPECRFQYRLEDGTAFAISPIDALEESQRLRQDEKIDGVPYLRAFSAWLVANGVPELPLDIVDWLSDHIMAQYSEIKKKRYEPLGLPSSTE